MDVKKVLTKRLKDAKFDVNYYADKLDEAKYLVKMFDRQLNQLK